MTGKDMVLYDRDRLERDEAKVRRGFWRKLRLAAGRVPFAEEAVGAYFCALDPRTPMRVKAVLFGALAYFVLPTDLIPDFVASIGFTDDAAVLYLAISTVSGHITDEHRTKARKALGL